MSTQTLSVGSKPQIEISNVGGDLTVQGWERNNIEARSDDSPRIEQDGDDVTLSCSSDLAISLPRGASLTIDRVGGDMKIENIDGNVEFTSVGGDVMLQNLTGEVSIEGAIGGEMQTENVRKISMDTPGSNMGADISTRVQRKVDEAMRRADRKMREAEQKMRHVEFKMQNDMARRMHHGAGQPVPPRPAAPPRWEFGSSMADTQEAVQPVSDEERMAILKMLQEKKITSEEADKLLAALEGGE
jgi:hypothetical protein